MMGNIKLTILIDNTPADNIRLSHEHGLAIYVETGGHRYLLDDCDDDVAALCDNLLQMAPAMNLYTGHCTGSRAIEKLQERLQDRFHLFRTGERYDVNCFCDS